MAFAILKVTISDLPRYHPCDPGLRTQPAEIAIDVRDAVKRYGDFTALQKISLAIGDNDFFTLSEANAPGTAGAGAFVAVCDEATQAVYDKIWTNLNLAPPLLARPFVSRSLAALAQGTAIAHPGLQSAWAKHRPRPATPSSIRRALPACPISA